MIPGPPPPQVLLSIIEKEALKSATFIVELFFPFNSVRGYFINLEFLIFNEYMFIGGTSWFIDIFSLYDALCLVTMFYLMCVLADISIAIPAPFWLLCMEYFFLLSVSICGFLGVK